MRILIKFVLVVFLIHNAIGKEENFWTWDGETNTKEFIEKSADLETASSEVVEAKAEEAEDNIEEIVSDILTSTRQGRNLEEYSEVSTDPNLQSAIQKGDDAEARNIIKEKLCHLGLMEVSRVCFFSIFAKLKQIKYIFIPFESNLSSKIKKIIQSRVNLNKFVKNTLLP